MIISSIFDLIGLILLGILASISISGIEGNKISPKILGYKVDYFRELPLQKEVAFLGILIVILITLKTSIHLLATKKMSTLLQNWAIVKSEKSLENYLNLESVLKKGTSKDKTIYLLSEGYIRIATDFINPILLIFSDSIQLILFVCLFFLTNKLLTFSMLVPLLIIASLVLRISNNEIKLASSRLIDTSAKLNGLIRYGLDNKRHLYVRNHAKFFSSDLTSLRKQYGISFLKLNLLPIYARAIFENLVILISLVLTGLSFYKYDAIEGASFVAVFLFGMARLSPLILKIQQNLMHIKSTQSLRDDILSLENESGIYPINDSTKIETKSSNNAIVFTQVDFKFKDSKKYLIQNISFEIEKNSKVAVVGKSGIGKSTLLDLLIGIKRPTSGEISIYGLEPRDFFIKNPTKVSIVEQKTSLIPGTVRQNVLFGTPQRIDDKEINFLIRMTKLDERITSLELDVSDFENEGAQLSGGERQRLALVRALVTKPEILVLDEISTGLDKTVEKEILQLILNLNSTTVVYVTHSKLFLNEFDKVIKL